MVKDKPIIHINAKVDKEISASASISNTLMALDILETKGLNKPLFECTPVRRRDIISIDPESLVSPIPSPVNETSLFKRWKKWWIKYRVDGKVVRESLDTKHKHIARIKQDEIESSLKREIEETLSSRLNVIPVS